MLFVTYRIVMRQRREDLQRRANEGQVDLEALALNQMKAPREVVDKMPLYTYLKPDDSEEAKLTKDNPLTSATEHASGDPSSSPNEDGHSSRDTGLRKPEAAVISPGPKDSYRSQYRLSHTQTTCAICIDDFVAGSSVVRELPCGHIFDAECIDPFLIQNSCLCPLCKNSVLPAGSFYISVTNEMVQREHLSRRS